MNFVAGVTFKTFVLNSEHKIYGNSHPMLFKTKILKNYLKSGFDQILHLQCFSSFHFFCSKVY